MGRPARGKRFLHLVVLVLLATAVLSDRVEVSDPNLDQQIKAAEEKQEEREEATPVVAQLIKEAPAAVLNAGTGDISTTGDCAGDIDNFCENTEAGIRRLADCLSEQQTEEEKGNIQGKRLTVGCKSELAAFKIDLATNVNKNIPLAEACKDDVSKLCKDEDPSDPGAILPCLREFRDQLSLACSNEVIKTQQEGAKDFRTDADLYAACDADAQIVCKGVKKGEGRIQACLRADPARVSWECQEELFRQEVENADNIMLNYVLMRKCMADKKKFCADVTPGNARVKDCLEAHRHDAGFSAECTEEFEKMMEARSQDFRLDSSLRDACAEDIELVCGLEKESLDNVQGFEASVVTCLQDYKEDLSAPKCKEQVYRLTMRAAEDFRFSAPLVEACRDDRQRLCPVLPGSTRIIRCLQDNRKSLGQICKAVLSDQEIRMAEDINFKFPMRMACAAEIRKFCGDKQHGNANIIRCLQEHQEETGMSSECKDEVVKETIRQSTDYRLNYKLARACESDRRTLCWDVCPGEDVMTCRGRVLRCLTDRQDHIASAACKAEVLFFQKMEGNDFRNDVPLAEACQRDIDKFCSSIQQGEGRILECLRFHRCQLQQECRIEELKLARLLNRDERGLPKSVEGCSHDVGVD